MTEMLDSVVEPTTTGQTDLLSIQSRKYRMETQTQQLIRGCEDLLVLVRQMQEIWLFGKLDAVGGSAVKEGMERDAEGILAMLKGLDGQGSRDGETEG